MSKQSYYQERLPDLIEKLKSQVEKNMLVVSLEVESDLGAEKYFNVLKGRRIAAENCIATMKRIELLEGKQKEGSEDGFFRELLPVLIYNLKIMYDLNLEVVDIEIEDEEDLGQFKDDEDGLIMALKKAGSLTEDKYHSVLKARQTAGIDAEWVLEKIDELEILRTGEGDKKEQKKSWSKRAAELKAKS